MPIFTSILVVLIMRGISEASHEANNHMLVNDAKLGEEGVG